MTNAVNLSNGLDGLGAGVSIMACGVIAARALAAHDPVLPGLMLTLAGSDIETQNLASQPMPLRAHYKRAAT